METDGGQEQDAGSSSQASGADPSDITRGAWMGSNVSEYEIDWLYRSRRIPEGVTCRLPGDEIEPVLEPGERVVFLAHFERGFGLPVSSFFRSFLDFYKLQPHHLPGNAIFYLSCYVTFMEAYIGIRPTRETFARFFALRINSVQGLDIPKPKPPVQCGSCIIGSRQGSPFFKFSGLESCRLWQGTFFYVKNNGAADLIDLPPFDPAPPTKTNWGYNPKESHNETNRIIRFMKQQMKDTNICSDDIIRTFISRRVLPLKRRAHKMCEMYGPGDPTKITGLPLSKKDAKDRFPGIESDRRGRCRKRGLDKFDPDPVIHWRDLKMGRTPASRLGKSPPEPADVPSDNINPQVHEHVAPLQAEAGQEFVDKLTAQGKKNKAPADAGSSHAPPAKRFRTEPLAGKVVAVRRHKGKQMPTSTGPALKLGSRPEGSAGSARTSTPPPHSSPAPSGAGTPLPPLWEAQQVRVRGPYTARSPRGGPCLPSETQGRRNMGAGKELPGGGTFDSVAMDRSWITDGTKKFTTKYMAGVRDFIKFAQEHLDNTDEPILCPCKDCLNLIRQDIKTVEDHCNCSGMSMTYTRWTRHGEDFSDDEGRYRDDDGAYDSDNDEEEDNGDCYVDDSSSMIDELQKSGNKGPDLPNIRITNRGFDLLLQLLRTALPDVDFPKSYADAKSVLSDVGLSYETIHACKFDCSLFWGDHKDDTHCHVCGVSRYRDPTGKKKIPHKVLRYFPIIKRLQRLFVKKEMSTHTRWHKEKRVVEPNVLRHPADGEAWKHFDGKFDWFAKDPRNIRLGFATDGFSPFGSMSNPYSMWPVFVIPYNFPPWMCMDQSNYMMALLIPGKYSPGKDFHVFMQPLIKDMMQLWSGVQTFDACTEEYFPLHAAFLWSIHDYPGYATMSGRSTRGFHACVHCDENPCAESLKNKIGYIGHRRFLDKSHPYRRSRLFNGKAETRDPPRKYTTKEVAAKVESVKDFEHGKNPISRKRKRATVPGEPTWHLKVSLHHLPYWPELKIAHNLDVMHIEKNICDNIVGTLLELEGRNKDTVSARIDLKKFKMWEKYWLKKIVKDDGDAAVTYAKPPAPWTLSKEQKRHLCRYLANTRFPDGYCANWGRCVNIDGCKVTGMKTHDCHILLQRVLPAGLKGIASKEMYVAIAELGRFFRELCAKTLKVDVLNRLKVEIVVILCKLEKLFPPAFFDVMVHLAIHLPEEALLRGPVHYGWMYPVERRLGYLKSTVRNKARPEGSIAEGYIVDECLIFCSRFFKDGTETRFNRDDRNQDIRRKPDRDEMEVFSVGAKGLGKSILNHFDKEFDKMVWYVLNNCDDVERYINEFRQELGGRGVRDTEETVQREFAGWFANHVRQLDNASEDLKSLAAGPDRRVVVYAGCNVKGARFRTLTRDKDLKTQNSGVATKGSFGDADETEYYGVLQEVLELQYGSNKHGDRSVYLFRCDWFDLASRGSKIKDDGYFKSVNTSVLWFKNSPFILASQAETCFYLEDTKFGDPWKVVQKFSHRHVYDVPELEDGNDDAFVRNEDAYQEDEGSVDHTFHDVVDLDEEAEVEAEEDDHRADEVVRIHDARTIRELENGEDSPNVDMDMSEDELQNEEESLIMEENIHDDEGKNSEEDSDVD
ncbi:hypothetical protein QYE76_021289 [Lolium multiflorum]|uniref:Transposon protein, putative, CACTA, En/Spm sub-class n=1 Tax=Lolium multiflorum TaxID=4521 RepID=A0AAD8R7F5_LOLMU|nr:hypothetical protein QYE76_021289 [Lolium multiflorum]